MAIVEAGQAELDGLLIGPGSPYVITRVAGFGVAAMRTSGYDRPQQDGAVAGADYLPGRQVLAVVGMRDGTAGGDLGDVSDTLAAKFAPLRSGTVEFDYWRPGDDGPRRLYVRPRRLALTQDFRWCYGVANDVPVELFAPDPRWYALDEDLVALEVPSADGGRTYPRTYPLAYGTGTGTSTVVTNDGNIDTWPFTTINGPITNPRLENVTTGQTLRFSIALAAGEFLEVDHHERTVKLGGTASRYNTLLSPVEWWPLQPGNSSIRLGADTSGVGASALVRWRDAWL